MSDAKMKEFREARDAADISPVPLPRATAPWVRGGSSGETISKRTVAFIIIGAALLWIAWRKLR